MAILTEQQYEEYIRLLKAWVEAEKGLEGAEEEVGPEARERVRSAYAAVQSFRASHGLGEERAMRVGEEVEADAR